MSIKTKKKFEEQIKGIFTKVLYDTNLGIKLRNQVRSGERVWFEEANMGADANNAIITKCLQDMKNDPANVVKEFANHYIVQVGNSLMRVPK